MGEVHYLPSGREGAMRLLERAVGEAIASHPDPRVAALWATMARETLGRWSEVPRPSVARLELELGGTLDEATRTRVLDALADWTESYFGDVRVRMMEMHKEILELQRRVAEHEASLPGNPDNGPDEG